MLVDDTPANLKLLEQMLKKRGYHTAAFPSGAMALRAAAKNPPDLILLDIMMPGMSGFEVCRQLKEDEALKEIPVLFISALDDSTNKVEAFSHGGVDYVTKPFQKEEVLARVNTHLRLRRMQRELRQHNLYLKDLVREQVQEISDSQLATIIAVSKLAEHRDDETGQHINRTRTFCRRLAEQLQACPDFEEEITDEFIDNIYYAAPLHDIGKVGIPDSILLKPGKLTAEEFEIAKTHVQIGVRTLETVQKQYPKNGFIEIGVALTGTHHEKWDGSGYPNGLAGKEIPLSGRIKALAEVYDALRSKRPYKEPFSHEKSCRIIREGKGTHFDPAVVDAFDAIEHEFDEIGERLRDPVAMEEG